MQDPENDLNKAPKDELEEEKAALKGYARYTGVAFQMMGIIAICAFLGYQADQYFGHKVQWVTALACVIGVCLSIYQTIRSLRS